MDRSAKPVSSTESGHGASALAKVMGRRMRELRVQRGLSRRDLGTRLGVSDQQIHKNEIGKNTMPLHRLLALASFCGVPPQAFWGQADAAAVTTCIPGADDMGILQLVRAYRRIGNAKLRRRLFQLVKQMAGEDEESASPKRYIRLGVRCCRECASSVLLSLLWQE
jgi:transcriptional regulator with XRE-family HTH domain